METEANNAAGWLIGAGVGLLYLFAAALAKTAGRADEAMGQMYEKEARRVDENADIDWPQEAA